MSEPRPTEIELRHNRLGKPRAYIAGTRVRVQDVHALSQQNRSPEEIAEALPHLNLTQVFAALAYFYAHRDEILQEEREDAEYASAMRASLGEGPLQKKLKSAG